MAEITPFVVDLQTYLGSSLGVTVYPGHVPMGVVPPALVLYRISNVHVHKLSGGAGVTKARYQIDCIGYNYTDCLDLAEELRNSLDGFRGTMGSTVVLYVRLADEVTLTDPPANDSDRWTYRKACDYIITYREEIG